MFTRLPIQPYAWPGTGAMAVRLRWLAVGAASLLSTIGLWLQLAVSNSYLRTGANEDGCARGMAVVDTSGMIHNRFSAGVARVGSSPAGKLGPLPAQWPPGTALQPWMMGLELGLCPGHLRPLTQRRGGQAKEQGATGARPAGTFQPRGPPPGLPQALCSLDYCLKFTGV